ncbi:MAG: glycosyltransferase family 4 protein [Oscillospiraceae bacterium]|nr:glycosyltransferase family 4 protein [Oscillospiraceae bacterium]
MNIWLINHYAVPPKYYPLARQTCFAKHLMAMGHNVTIFAASTVHNSDQNLITDGSRWREETDDGVHYVYIKCMDYAGSGLKRIYNICEFAWKLPGVCKKFPKPDAIVATSMPPTSCAVGVKLARKYGCKGIAEIADLWPESIVAYDIAGPRNPAVVALRWLEKWIYKKADAVVFTMENAYQYIEDMHWQKQIPREKVHYVNNGVDLALFEYNKEHYHVEDVDLEDESSFKVIYTGSIRKVNNLGLLLDAAKKVTDGRIRFLIWGGGDELPALQQRVVDEQIQNVIFKGKVDKAYIPYIVSKADLNIAHNTPSPLFRYGISFNKLFDYLAAGKPILSDFSCGHNPAVIFGASIEVTEPTPENIARAIETVTNMEPDEYHRLCANAKAAAVEYSFENLTKKLSCLIQNISK